MELFDCSSFTLISILIAAVPLGFFFFAQFFIYRCYHASTSCECKTGTFLTTARHVNTGDYIETEVNNLEYIRLMGEIRNLKKEIEENDFVVVQIIENEFKVDKEIEKVDVIQHASFQKINKYTPEYIGSLKLKLLDLEDQLKNTPEKFKHKVEKQELKEFKAHFPVKCKHRIFFPVYWGMVFALITFGESLLNWIVTCDQYMPPGINYAIFPVGLIFSGCFTCWGAIIWKFF